MNHRMNRIATNWSLNRIRLLHSRSLPVYLHDANPWTATGNGRPRQVLDQVVSDQQQMADRLAELIIENEGAVEPGRFPMRFTGYNDLSFDYLLRQMIERQREAVAAIEAELPRLRGDVRAERAANDALAAARRHLAMLEELATRKTKG